MRKTVSLLAISLLLAQAQAAQELRIGFFPNVTHAAALVGIQKGFFKQALPGVKITDREFAAGNTLMEAFIAGELDVAYVGPGPALTGFSRGVPLQIIAGASNAGAVLVVRGDTAIKSYADLKGKVVAIPALGATQDITLRHILKTENLRGQVTVQPIPPADMAAAFSAKRIDAALVPEPWGAVLQKQGARLLGTEKTLWRNGNYPTTIIIVNTKFAKNNPDLVRKFLKGHKNAVDFINKSPKEARKSITSELLILTKQSIAPDVLNNALNRTKIGNQYDLNALKEYADLAKEAGYLRGQVDFNNLVNNSYLK